MNYLDIAIANEQIQTTDIKGKQYSEVNQRIKAFRINHPNGSIATHIESLADGVVVMSCEVRDEFGNLLGKAHAYEKEDSSYINKTSFIENCCTSATGRALGYAGYGIDVSVSSAEEVQNAINNQEVTKEEADSYTLTFGKHKGKKMNELPKDYIEWLMGNTKDERILKIIELTTGLVLPSEEEQLEVLELITKLKSLAIKTNTEIENICKTYEVENLKDMTKEQLKQAIKSIQAKGK